ncbi:response regulator transcription factor [bacterium]|nr:response regulator transcription factor [bacterium]
MDTDGQRDDESSIPRLTKRQREVLDLLVRGYSNPQIAEARCASNSTIIASAARDGLRRSPFLGLARIIARPTTTAVANGEQGPNSGTQLCLR